MRLALVLAALIAAPVAPAVAAPVTTKAVPVAVKAMPAPTRFDVTVVGKGPDVILIPGLASSSHVWDATVAALKGRYRLHVLQVAGFAGTPVRGNASGPILASLVDEVAAYIKAQRLKAPAIIGHSMGGLTAQLVAATYPNLVGRVMIVDALPWYALLFGPSVTPAAVEAQGRAIRDGMIAAGQESYAKGSPSQMARLVKSDNDEAKAAMAAGAASNVDAVARAFYDVIITDARPKLPAITAPVTVLYAYDPVMGVPAERMDALYKGAYATVKTLKAQRIDGSFHFIMIDQKPAFLTAVEMFLAAK
jgi:pimeloyl-ACP methyl ester carboxylesterase